MKKIVSILCGIILATTALWAEQIKDVTLSAPGNTTGPTYYDTKEGTNKPLVTQTISGGNRANDLNTAWNNGSQTGLALNVNQSTRAGEATMTFSAPAFTTFRGYRAEVWSDWSYQRITINLPFVGEVEIANNNSDLFIPTYSIAGGENKQIKARQPIEDVAYTSNSLVFKTTSKGAKLGDRLDLYYRVFSNNWKFGITVPEVIQPTNNPTTTLNKITESELLAGEPTRTATLTFTVKDPIGTNSTNIKNYFDASIIASNGSTWSLGDTWDVFEEASNYLVKIPVTFEATTDEAGIFQATVQLKPKHNVQYNGTDYSVGRTQIVKVEVNQKKGTYDIDWRPDGWVNGGTITIFKGDSYERNDYLKNTDGLTLAIPASSNPGVVSVDPTTGKITATEVGFTVLTYTQSGLGDYEDKTLTLNVNVIKRTPVFTLNSESTYTANGNTYHVFYPNKSYPNFVTTTNGDLVNYPVTITPEGDMTNIISFNGVSAKVESALRDGIKITIFQQSGNLWMENSQDFYISIRNNPMHVGTLCEQSLADLFANRVISKSHEVKYENGDIVIGSTGKGSNGGYIVFQFSGTPEQLEWQYTTTAGGSNAVWKAEQSINGSDFYDLKAGNTFDDEARYVKLTLSGQYQSGLTTYGATGKITDICITERVGVEILPAEIELVKTGNEVKSAAFSAEVSNLTKVVLTINSSEFGLARTESDAPQTNITLDYMDGLGIDQFATIPLVVKYTEDVDDSAIGKTCTITAKDADGNQLAVANVKVTGIILVDGVPQTILQPNATNTGIYTGTNKSYNTFPYKPKVEVDLSATFDVNGVALFDYLYIFGLTTPADNNAAGNLKVVRGRYERNQNIIPDAVTPCYIYKRTDAGNGYIHQTTIPNMNLNAATKPINTIAATGQKIYFTGHCPYASNGTANDQFGVFYIEGGAGARIDLYFEDLYLHARPHTDNGACYFKTTDTIRVALSIGDNYMPASAAPFFFKSTSGAPFRPFIHLRDSNKLDGGMGAVEASILGIKKQAGLYSPPIQLYAANDDECTELTIDDLWPTEYGGIQFERTNGILDLCPSDVQRPSLELANAKSTVNFNGGQIYLKNSELVSDQYLCTYAIGMRYFKYEISVVSVSLHGMGDDQPDGYVNFNDGSIHCVELSADLINKYGQYYRSATSMKCPVNTKINGGTYYCDIWACAGPAHLGASPKDKYGNALVTAQYPINNVPASPFYLATVNWDSIASAVVCQQEDHDYNGYTLAEYYESKESTYGCASLKADKNNKVTFMMPYQFTDKKPVGEEFVYNWVLCMPTFNAGAAGYNQTLGGAKTVRSSENEHTRFLLYAECGDKEMEVAAGYDAQYTTPDLGLGEIEIELTEGEYRNDVLNTASYQVDEAQYIIKPIPAADKWLLFCPPFDVSNVYVIEAYPEEELVTMAKESTDDARYQQSWSTMDVFSYLGFDIELNDTNRDFWNIFSKWQKDDTLKKGRGAVKLEHFTGRNYTTAHYYLQRSSGNWTWDASANDGAGKFITDWKYLPATDATDADSYYKVMHGDTEYNVVMKKGEIYAVNFPYMYDGYMEGDGTWDYWTGKFLIFEGLGPQTIEGKDYHTSTLLANMDIQSGEVQVRGNNTFAALTVEHNNAYYMYSDGGQKFTNSSEEEEVIPTEGFVLANIPAPVSTMPARKAAIDMMTGDVTYEDDEDNEPSTPTIAPDHDLLVYTTPTGLAVIPLISQQVAIYNTAGQLVTSRHIAEETQFDLPSGIYFVRGETERVKAMVK